MPKYRVEDAQGNQIMLSDESSLFECLQDILFHSAPNDCIEIHIEEPMESKEKGDKEWNN
jgi:hypothetical protein